MNPEHPKKISMIIAGVFKTMAFMFAEPMDKSKIPMTTRDMHEWVKTWMEFQGPLSGSLTMLFPVELCTIIAANVLGLDSNDERAIIRNNDAAAELLNVVCGQILTELAGEKPIFDLTVPQKAAIGAAEVEAFCAGNDEALAFSIENKPIVVKLNMRETGT
jgi:CheY-specific phosphatase CheX